MIRFATIFLIGVLVVAVVLALAGEPGQASIVWLGWRLDSSATAIAVVIAAGALFAVLFWSLLVWLAASPQRAAKAQAELKARQGAEILAKGYLALAAGDGAEARRCARKAADLAVDAPALVRILTAQAAEMVEDLPAADAAYKAMLGFPEMRLAGRRGLMRIAEAKGDRAAALAEAQAAFDLAGAVRWPLRVLVDAKVVAGEWSEGLALIDTALSRKIISPVLADRARAALLTASAASLENAASAKGQSLALEQALRAAKLKPDLTPASLIAARLYAFDSKVSRAEDVLEAAFAARPHPAVWLFYRDLRGDETPRERARRLQRLIDAAPDSREGKILALEQALLLGDRSVIAEAVAALQAEPVTRRLSGVLSRAAIARGLVDEARAYVARGAGAPDEGEWSDIDPDGRAFNYGLSDWSALVSAYAQTGELIHPRAARGERTISDLPELPPSYEASAAFLSAAAQAASGGAAPLPDDPGPYIDAPVATSTMLAPSGSPRRRPGGRGGRPNKGA